MKKFEGFDFFLSQIKPNLKDATAFAFDYLLDQYQEIIGQAESHLIQAARELEKENEKERFIAAIEQCQRLKGGMVNAFGLNMMEAFRILNGEEAETGQHMDIQGSLSSLASHAREDDLFIHDVIYKAGNEYADWIDQVTAGLQKALPTAKFNNKNNPFGPITIGNALHASLKISSMHSSVKKEIYVLARDILLSRLNVFYKELLNKLKQSGIQVVIPSNSGFIIETVEQQDIPLLEPVTMELDTIDSHFNELIEEGVIPPNYTAKDYMPLAQEYEHITDKTTRIVPLKEIDSLLGNLQKGYDPTSDGTLPEYIRSHLALESDDKTVNVMERHDENIINLISLVFDQIAETQSEEMARLFSRLKVPYTRVVLNDELFFHDTTHPARELLDRLLALTYTSDDDNKLLKQVQHCTMKILLKYNGEQSLFREQLKVVEEHHEKNAGPFQESRDAMMEKLEAEEKRRFALAAVQGLIFKRTKALPRRLRFHILVEKFWEEILVDISMTKGTKSKHWEIALKLLDIITILTSNGETPQFKKLTADLPKIAGKLSQFLSEFEISHDRKNVFIDQLQEIQILLLRGSKLTDIDDDDLSHTFNVDMIIDDYESEMVADIDTSRIGSEHKNSSNAGKLELIPEKKRPKKASADAFVNNLYIGQWMNFIVDNQRTPCVVSYFSKQKNSYTFCDRHNQKLFVRKKEEIAEDLIQGFACPLENTLCFDGNLARVITRLNQ